MTSAERHQFLNRLRVLHSLDQAELGMSGDRWLLFREHPARFLIRADGATAARIMDAVERREA